MTMTSDKPTVGRDRAPEANGTTRQASRSLVAWFRDADHASWLKSKAVAAWMNVLIALVVSVTVVTAGFYADQRWPAANTWGVGSLKVFALWCFAFLPGWLYIRFLGMRANALWTEYVLTLHRLGLDGPANLPEPVPSSEFHRRWRLAGGPALRAAENIYQQKFECYYGRQVTPDMNGTRVKRNARGDFIVRTESLFPIFLATAVFAAGWAAVLWNCNFLSAPSGIADALKFGFLGAYAFVVSLLIRRFFQSDLRPSAYATAVVRVMLVLLLVTVVGQLTGAATLDGSNVDMALAFLIGFFPLIGLQVIQGLVSKTFGLIVPSLRSDYPLDQLDGFDIWYESRLAEEGIEDIQNLITMNIVDVILHTRVPAGRLVDWINQGFLLIRIGSTAGKQSAAKVTDRQALRSVGIRTATDLLTVFSKPKPGGHPWQREFVLPDLGPGGQPPLPQERLRLLVTALCAEAGLATVWNWQHNGVKIQAGATQLEHLLHMQGE
jgi:hypothetical protein